MYKWVHSLDAHSNCDAVLVCLWNCLFLNFTLMFKFVRVNKVMWKQGGL